MKCNGIRIVITIIYVIVIKIIYISAYKIHLYMKFNNLLNLIT